jgi:DNA-binding transcriptional LysR family regulator
VTDPTASANRLSISSRVPLSIRAVVEYLCNRVGGFMPDVRHHTDDALILRALVSSGHAVTLLPALIGTATPRVALRQIDGVRLTRSTFTATRGSSCRSAAIQAVRAALAEVAREVTDGRDDARVA